MANVQSMAPVAAIVDLMLGIVTLIMISKVNNKAKGDKIAGFLIGWILVFQGMEYLFLSILEFQVGSASLFGTVDTSDTERGFLLTGLYMFQISVVVLMSSLALVFPFRILPDSWDEKAILGSVCILSISITTIHLVTDFDFLAIENILMVPAFVILISLYIRFLTSELRTENDSYRKVSIASGLILIGMFGESMTYWLSQVLSINDEFNQRIAIEFSIMPSGASWFGMMVGMSLGAIAICVLFLGEIWRSYNVGAAPFSIMVFVIFIVGFIAGIADVAVLDIVTSCYDQACQEFPSAYNIWYDFTSESLVYLYTPILFMFLLLKYDLIDTQSGNNKWLIRIIVILLLLIVSSTVLELVQSFLPIPEMISSAALAIIVAIFIGWEEKIVTQLISGAESVSHNLPFEDGRLESSSTVDPKVFNLTLSAILLYILILSMLHSGLTKGGL